jgi:hypothetical protein
LWEKNVNQNSILSPVVRECTRGPTIKRAFYVALVVGTILNLLNHYDVLFLGAALTFEILMQMVLTIMVPYIVSTHGQVCASLAAQKGEYQD